MAGDKRDHKHGSPHPEPWPKDVEDAMPDAHMPATWDRANWHSPGPDETTAQVPTRPIDDEAVATIRRGIIDDIHICVDDLHVALHGRHVRIEGRVRDEATHKRVLEKAAGIVGPAAIEDAVLVRP